MNSLVIPQVKDHAVKDEDHEVDRLVEVDAAAIEAGELIVNLPFAIVYQETGRISRAVGPRTSNSSEIAQLAILALFCPDSEAVKPH